MTRDDIIGLLLSILLLANLVASFIVDAAHRHACRAAVDAFTLSFFIAALTWFFLQGKKENQ